MTKLPESRNQLQDTLSLIDDFRDAIHRQSGWTKEERDAGMQVCSLAERFARSETAPMFTVGAYTLCEGRQQGKVWIEHETGEGGDFTASKVEAAIAAFYKEHF